jgi:arylsulfatase A-like enzyme
MTSFRHSLAIGCIGALSAATIDAVTGFAAAATRFSSPEFVLLTVGLTALLALLVFMFLRWVVVLPIWRRAGDAEALSIATAVSTVVLFIICNRSVGSSHISEFLGWVLNLAVALACGLGWYVLVVEDNRRPEPAVRSLLGRSLVVVAPLTLVSGWVVFAVFRNVMSIRGLLTLACAAALAFAAVRASRRLAPRHWQAAAGGLYGIVIALGISSLVLIERSRDVSATTQETHAHGKIKQVIFLTVDTLRRDSLSCYGSTTVATPNIDQIAASSYFFRNVTSSSSWTEPAFASLITGLPTEVHRVVTAAAVLPDTVTTMAERFRAAGYATAGFIANGMLAPQRGFAQGFQQYETRTIRPDPVSVGDRLAEHFFRKPIEEPTTTGDVTNLAIAWTRAHRAQSFFLWLHYYDPHLPYIPPRRFVQHMDIDDKLGYSLNITSLARPTMDLFGTPEERAWARSLYDADVRYVDSQIGRFVAALKDEHVYDDALVVFAVDHGEEFWDHDGFEHGHTLYQELIGVPLMFKLPQAKEQHVVNEAVSGYDVTPTILDLCGLRPVDTPTGASMAPRLRGEIPALHERPLFAGGTLFHSNLSCVVFDGWKFIRSSVSGDEKLFNLMEDPGERSDVDDTHPDIVTRARALLDEHERAMEAYRREHGIFDEHVKLDPDELARLRTLGYL